MRKGHGSIDDYSRTDWGGGGLKGGEAADESSHSRPIQRKGKKAVSFASCLAMLPLTAAAAAAAAAAFLPTKSKVD